MRSRVGRPDNDSPLMSMAQKALKKVAKLRRTTRCGWSTMDDDRLVPGDVVRPHCGRRCDLVVSVHSVDDEPLLRRHLTPSSWVAGMKGAWAVTWLSRTVEGTTSVSTCIFATPPTRKVLGR